MRRLLLVFMVFVCMGFSSATFISMTSTIQVEGIIEGDEAISNLTLVNSGDEPAHDVFVSMMLPDGMQSNDLFLGMVYPDEVYSGEFTIVLVENVTPGTYSIPMIVDYKDANGHPFSAVSIFSLIVRKPAFSKVTAKVSELTVGGSETGDLRLLIRNLDVEPHTVDVDLFLSRELYSEIEEETVFVDKKSDEDLTFGVSSFDALPGSDYAVFVVVSYEEDGLHYSTSSGGIVHVVEERNTPSWLPMVAIVALVFLVLVFIVCQFRK